MDTALGRDNAAYLTPVFAAAEYDLTAAAGTDNSEQTWATIDRLTTFDNVRHASAAAVVMATATLGEDETLTVSGIWEHSDDEGSTWTEIGTDTTLLTLTGGSGGSTETGTGKLNINLAEADGQVRFKQTPDLSASGTDTAKVSGVYIFSAPSEI